MQRARCLQLDDMFYQFVIFSSKLWQIENTFELILKFTILPFKAVLAVESMSTENIIIRLKHFILVKNAVRTSQVRNQNY